MAKPDALPPGARRRMKFDKHAAPGASAAAAQTPTPIAGHSASEEPAAPVEDPALRNPEPEVQPAPGFAIPQFVYAIGFYVVLNYFLG